MGAEAARVRGLQRLAIISRREAVDHDGVLALPCVQRMEQLRAEAVAVVPHRRHVREVVCPHIQLPLHPFGGLRPRRYEDHVHEDVIVFSTATHKDVMRPLRLATKRAGTW